MIPEGHPCKDCGLCCMHMATPPFVGVGHFRKDCPEDSPTPEMEEKFKQWIFSPRRRYADHQPCIWLNRINGECMHHGIRPQICRDYEPGCESCNKLRKEAGLPLVCNEKLHGPMATGKAS